MSQTVSVKGWWLVSGLCLAVMPAARVLPAQVADGARIYAATCVACHQASGLGLPGQFPPLVGSEWVTGSEERLIRIILHGLVGEIEVEGESFTGAMPTWGPTFKDEELAAVATYVRRSWGNKAAPITTATVTRIRLATASRTTPWTARELEQALRAKPPA
ncbi:MAG: cytochrome c [Gemmatimonadaceae bacterium]|nr:cytochrome c [Gemmatimonadaceae bacterium]